VVQIAGRDGKDPASFSVRFSQLFENPKNPGIFGWHNGCTA
jgi:hypothetical protein